MNVAVMAAMMAVMWLLFHGKGHHAPASEPGHHRTQPDQQPAASKAQTEAKPSGSPDGAPKPRPDRSENRPAPPPKAE